MNGLRVVRAGVIVAVVLGVGCAPSAGGVVPAAPVGVQPTAAVEAPAAAPEPAPAPEPERLVGPDLYKIVMGVDSPEQVASKIGASGGPIACPPDLLPDGKLTPAEKRTEKQRKMLCWRASGMKDTPQVRANFYDYGVGSVVYDLWFIYPLGSLTWLAEATRTALGSPDTIDASAPMQSWSWTHTEVAVGGQQCENMKELATCKYAGLGLTHWPTLYLSTNGVTNRASSVADRSKPATPWDIRLGYDSQSVAEAKLRAAGFAPSVTGCLDQYPGVKRCSMDLGSLRGLRNGTQVELVTSGYQTRVSGLVYTFELSAYADIVRQLNEAYGKPVNEDKYGKSNWWTGEVGIEVQRRDDSFQVTYFHGRLHQLSYKAMYQQEAARAQTEKRGL